jgi:DNA modification methylase
MIIIGDAKTELQKLPSESIDCCVTSPPYYGLRDYGVDGQIGLEETPGKYVEKMVDVFAEVSRVLKDSGTLWLNLGDSYSGNGGYKTGHCSDKQLSNNGSVIDNYRNPSKIGLKPKNLIGIPWKVAFALQESGLYLRQDIIWHKPNPMPESVKDRCTKAHEYIFLFSKSEKYYFDSEAIREPAKWDPENTKTPDGWDTGSGAHGNFHRNGREKGKKNSAYSFQRKTATIGKPGVPNQHREDRENIEYSGMRNKRSVWTVSTKPYKEAHFATFPPDLIESCILAGCQENGIVLDPFAGSGTVGEVAKKNGREFILIELNQNYKPLIDRRIERTHYQRSF